MIPLLKPEFLELLLELVSRGFRGASGRGAGGAAAPPIFGNICSVKHSLAPLGGPSLFTTCPPNIFSVGYPPGLNHAHVNHVHWQEKCILASQENTVELHFSRIHYSRKLH